MAEQRAVIGVGAGSDVDRFEGLLSAAGWTVPAVADGARGRASFTHGAGVLSLEYRDRDGSVALDVASPDHARVVRMQLAPGEHLDDVVRWSIRHQHALTPANLTIPLTELYGLCREVLLLGEDGEAYPIKR